MATTSLSRRNFLRGGMTVAAVGAVPALFPPLASGAVEVPAFLPYSSDSYFKSRVTNASVNSTRTALFRTFMATHPDQQGYAYPKIMGIGDNRWGTPWARGAASDPIWRVRNISGVRNWRNAVLKTKGFRGPEWISAAVTGTSDSPLCVMDTASGFTVFFTQVKVVGDHVIDVATAAVTHHASNGLDYRNPKANDARNFTSRGRISDAMVIRKDRIDYGIANNTDLGHVLQLFIVESKTADGFCHPMVGEESGKYGFGAEGERLAIRSGVDLTKRGLSPSGLVIARTLQNRGTYVGDNAGSHSTLKAEQETSAHRVWGSQLNQHSLKGLTWDDFVVLNR